MFRKRECERGNALTLELITKSIEANRQWLLTKICKQNLWVVNLDKHMDSHASLPFTPTKEGLSPMCTTKQKHQCPTINALT